MSFGDFFFKSNKGSKINLDFKGNICRKDFEKDPKLLKIFDYFDTDKNGVIESFSPDGNNEISNLLQHVKHASNLRNGDNDVILDSQEVFSLTHFIKELNGISSDEFFDFLNIVENKKNKIVNEKTYISPDGTKTITNTYKDKSVETIIFSPNGKIKFRAIETPISEDFSNSDKNTVGDRDVYKKNEDNTTKELSLVKGAKEGHVNLTEDSLKYLSQKYNKDVYSAYFVNGVLELRDKNDKPFFQIKIDISKDTENELRNFIGNHLKESSERVLEYAKTIGWIDKLGIDLQDIDLNPAMIPLALLNPVFAKDILDANGMEMLEKNLNALKENVKNGKLLENGATNKAAFDSRFERFTGNQNVNFLQVEQFRQTALKYDNVKAINQRITLLNEGIKDIKNLYYNYRSQKKGGTPTSDMRDTGFNNKMIDVFSQFFNGDEGVAKAFIAAIAGDITSKENLFNKFNEIIDKIKDTAMKTKNDLLNGESEEELENRYRNDYKNIYGQDIPFQTEELINNGKETGGFIQLGLMTTAQIILGALTAGTGNAALLALQGNALIGFLTTVGTDYALSLSNILTSERGFTQEAQDELHQRTIGTGEFVGFGMIVANPLARGVGKYVSKLFKPEAEKIMQGAFAQSAKVSGVSRTVNGAITKTSLSGEAAFEWLAIHGAEFGTEILAFSGFELVKDDQNFKDAISGQANMLTKLKIMNSAIQVLLGSFVRNQAIKGQAKLAIKEYNQVLKDMGIENAKLTENKRPGNSTYTLELNGETTTFNSIKDLQANFMAIVAESFIKTKAVDESIKALSDEALINEFNILLNKKELSETDNSRLVDLYKEMEDRKLDIAKNEEILTEKGSIRDIPDFIKNKTPKEVLEFFDNILSKQPECRDGNKVATLKNGICLIKRINGEYLIEYPKHNALGYEKKLTYNEDGILEEIANVTENNDGNTIETSILLKNNEPCIKEETIYFNNKIIKRVSENLINKDKEIITYEFVNDKIAKIVIISNESSELSLRSGSTGYKRIELIDDINNNSRVTLQEWTYPDGSKTTREITNSGQVIEIFNDGKVYINSEESTIEEAQKISEYEKTNRKMESQIKESQKKEYRGEIPDGFVIDKNTRQPIKVNIDKIETKIKYDKENKSGNIEITDEFGNQLGIIEFNIRTSVNELYFHSFASFVNGCGIGTKLLSEIIKFAKKENLEITAIAGHNPRLSGAKKEATNLKFYYKMGFRAQDPVIDKIITEYIEKGLEIPTSLNRYTPIKYVENTKENDIVFRNNPIEETKKQNILH